MTEHICPTPKLSSLPWYLLTLAFKKELVKEWGSLTGERVRVPCEFPPERPPGLCPAALGHVCSRQAAGLSGGRRRTKNKST